MQEYKLRTVCYPFPARQGYKKAKSVGRRQGNQARPFFGTVRKRTTEPIEQCSVSEISFIVLRLQGKSG